MDYEDKHGFVFGDNFDEYGGFEYTIPEGFEAEIKDGKVIMRKKDSEDERIRKELVEFITTIKDISESGRREWAICTSDAEMCKRFLAYLEKKQQPEPIEPISKCSKNWLNDGRVLSYGLNDLEQVIHRGFLSAGVDASFELIEETAKECLSLMKPAEWSEEDEKTFELLHTCVCRCINDDRLDYAEREQISRRLIPFIERLKSLRPQSHWKPSKEQMEVLLNTEGLVRANNYPENAKILASLYEQLKKL